MDQTLRRAEPAWVPVERRFIGLDRATLRPAGFVLAVAIVLAGVLPLFAAVVPWEDEVKPGETIAMGGGITFAPPVGWELTDGFRAEAGRPDPVSPSQGGTASVTNGVVTIRARSAAWNGSVAGLLKQVDDELETVDKAFRAEGGTTSLTTETGITGAVESWTATSTEGLLAAFTFPRGGDLPRPYGVSFTVSGPAGGVSQHGAEVEAVLRSLAVTGGAQ